MPDDFRQAIEAIKLRTPIEEVVRERVGGLRRAGSLWAACCPFHDERTPSFKVNPQRGTWHCFGACARGGDVISFVEAFDRLEFMEALEVLAARAGVELPQRKAARDRDGHDRLFAVLERASAFYQRALHGPEGAGALAYLRERGLATGTLEAFGIGYSPVRGDALVRKATGAGHALADLVATGLVRTSDTGRPYDFFRGRLMVPIRDLRGRTVGFGARRLDDSDPRSPKYVNTPETPLFKKGQLIYGLDLAVDHVRRARHMILVEGYTDVCAAHQVGLRNVVAVLGTSTTDEHAALVRRSGARRVSLVFDGDEAGARATLRALQGLLPMELEVDVVRLETGRDPCDLLIADGSEALERPLGEAQSWFDFLLSTFAGQTGARRFEAIDVALETIGRLKNPLHLDQCLTQLADAEGHPIEAVRQQFESLPARRREARRRETERREAAQAAAEASAPEDGPEPVLASDPARESRLRAWRELAGAVLVDGTLLEEARDLLARCEDGELAVLLGHLIRLAEGPAGLPGVDAILSALADEPVRHMVVPLLEEAMTAESPRLLYDGARTFIERTDAERAIRERARRLAGAADEGEEKRDLAELFAELRRNKVPSSDSGVRRESANEEPQALR